MVVSVARGVLEARAEPPEPLVLPAPPGALGLGARAAMAARRMPVIKEASLLVEPLFPLVVPVVQAVSQARAEPAMLPPSWMAPLGVAVVPVAVLAPLARVAALAALAPPVTVVAVEPLAPMARAVPVSSSKTARCT